MSDDLKRLVKLAEMQLSIEQEVAEAEEKLKLRKALLRQISEVDLPDLMAEVGLTKFALVNGKEVKIKEDLYAKIPDDKFHDAMLWLSSNGYSGIVKSTITASFGKEEIDKAELILSELREEGVSAEMKQGVHPQTLKAFVKERLAAEEAIPFDVFGIMPFNKAVIS